MFCYIMRKPGNTLKEYVDLENIIRTNKKTT